MSVRSGPTLHKHIFLSEMYLNNIDQTIFLCKVAPPWSIPPCIGCFPHKSCLLTIGQQTTLHRKKNPVQCCPSWDNMAQVNALFLLLNRLQKYFCLGPVSFLTTRCCKCHATIPVIFQTMNKKNLGQILNKKTRLYGTQLASQVLLSCDF